MTYQDNTFLSSDLVIFNALKATTDEFISACNLYFINQSMASDTTNSIYVGGINSTKYRDNHDGEEFHNLINIYINSKNTDYEYGSRFLRTVCEHILNVLYHNPLLQQRGINVKSITYDYGDKYSIKGLHLIVECDEFRAFPKTMEFAKVTYDKKLNDSND